MSKYAKKPRKDNLLRIRISEEEKQQYITEAECMGMSLSQYVLHLLRHKQVNRIEGGVELAREIYEINRSLDQIAGNHAVPVQELRDAVTQCMASIATCAAKAVKREAVPCQS